MADVAELRGHAEQAATHLEALADGLDGAGADPNAVKAVSQMAADCNDIAGQLHGGGSDSAPPEEAPPQEKPATMASATNDMQNEMKARRGGK